MYPGMNKRFVEFDEKHPNAMTDSLRECEIAIVVMWPSWPETYSYTCMDLTPQTLIRFRVHVQAMSPTLSLSMGPVWC